MGADTPEIVIGAVQEGLYVGMLGRATQRTCPTADYIINDYLSSNPQAVTVVLELSGCDWIDSTFAGWLVGLLRRLKRTPGGRLVLSNCAERCRRSLDKMGLAVMFEFEEYEVPESTQTIRCTTSDQPTAEELKLMLEAHETLSAVSPENERLFTPIADALRSQLERR